ncbi:Pentatricopeptide repeat-containing protein [Spatholobus suberectus]|nr:Pentatricopeptide repeat-containing protein [Spatholobus suberectus]
MATPILQCISHSPTKLNTETPRHESTTLALEPSPSLLSLIPKCTSLRELKQIQAYTIKTHLHNNPTVLTKLINFCTSNPTTASMDHAHRMFDQIPQPDIVLFNTMARGYARFDDPLRAILLFSQVLCSGLLPDDYTFSSLIKACARLKALQEGKQLHCLAVKLGLSDNMYVCPTLINMYTACNDMDAARRVFDKIDEPFVVAYNAVIASCARNSRPTEALSLFRELQESGLKPTDVTTLVALSSCALLGALDLGRWIHEYVKKNGFDQYVKWPGSYCDTQKSCCYPTTGKPAADFGIHGLWPNYNDGSYPSNCDPSNPFNPSEISDLTSSLQKSVFKQHDYFEAALNLRQKANLLQALTSAGIQPDGQSYSLSSIKGAIKDAIGYTPFIECNVDSSGNSQLYQVYLCVNTSGSDFLECPVFPRGKCGSNIEFPSF